jgi:peptidoglycan/LPS O-acetylase OafA/YrhL
VKPGFSLSLDLIRFSTAMIVFVAHFAFVHVSGQWLMEIWSAPFAHHAVMVFFVLSGLVIAYVVSDHEQTLDRYMRARLVRLYSVVVPMIVLVPLIDWVGHQLDPELYDGWWFRAHKPVLKLFASLFFLHETWWRSVWYFSNGPYWSIGYEFWYYVAFGALWFLRGFRRVLALLATFAIAGPKIFLLFPVWLTGVGVWHLCARIRLPALVAVLCLIGAIVAYILWIVTGAYQVADAISPRIADVFGVAEGYLTWSKPWLGYYVLALLIAVVFLSLHSLSPYVEKLLSPAARVIRWAAGATFTIYLFHIPVTLLVASAVPGEAEDPVRLVIVFAIILTTLFLIAEFTERKKAAFGAAYDYLFAKISWLYRAAILMPAIERQSSAIGRPGKDSYGAPGRH